MRVGIITYGLDRPLTGIGRYTVELIRSMQELSDVEITLLTAGEPLALPGAAEFRQLSLPGSRLLPGLISVGNLGVRSIARRERFDIIHDPCGLAPFLFDTDSTKKVVTIHDTIPLSCPGNSTFLETWVYRNWLPRVIPLTDRVITDSKASKSDLELFFNLDDEKVTVIYPGIDKTYKPGDKKQVMMCKEKYALPQQFILFVGSIAKRKNLLGVIHALGKLKSKGKVYHLVIVGPGEYKPLMSLIDSLDLADQVYFTNYVPKEDLPLLYSAASLFVFPSFCEGFGFPPLEAMACGTPVLCSNAGSLPEVVGEAAIIVAPSETAEIAERILQITENGDIRERLIATGFIRSRKFDWKTTARETLSVYRELLG